MILMGFITFWIVDQIFLSAFDNKWLSDQKTSIKSKKSPA